MVLNSYIFVRNCYSTLAKVASSEQNRIMLLGDLFLRIWRKLGLHR